MTKLRFRCHNAVLFNTFCRPTRLKGERCAPRHWNQYRMLSWRFFRPYLGIFASIDADGAAFAAEMRRNSDGRSLGWMSESRARPASPSLQTELEAAEMEWLELELLRETT